MLPIRFSLPLEQNQRLIFNFLNAYDIEIAS